MPYLKLISKLILSTVLFVGIFLVTPKDCNALDSNNWTEVASNENGKRFINTDSIKYDSKGILSILTRYLEIDAESQSVLNSKTSILEIDCDKRLFKKSSVDGKEQSDNNWKTSVEDRLIKRTIIKSCTY